MDRERIEALTARLGDGSTRRAGLKAALGVLFGAGAATAGPEREADAKKKRCRPKCGAAQRCEQGTCVCKDGGSVCGTSCCRIGQECRDGQCVELPEPGQCVAFGQVCKDVGRPCCENLQCGSGQGGSAVACWVRKTGRCTSTAECIYGTECTDGICVGLPPRPTCDVATCTCPVPEYLPQLQPAVQPNCDSGACGCTCEAYTVDIGGEEHVFAGRSCSGLVAEECGALIQGYFCMDMERGLLCDGPSTCCCVKRENP